MHWDTQELKDSLRCLKNTSPGHDNIENLFLRKLPPNYLEYVLKLFNKSWVNEEVIADWKLAFVAPILKPNKSPLDVQSYLSLIHI